MGFTNTPFLLGLIAIGLPILIHFLTRARPRAVRYPTYHLLVEAGSGRQAIHRLRTWVILAMRALFVAAFVLALTKPFLKSPGEPATTGESRRVVLVIDASVSMRAVRGGVTLFAKAAADAAEFLRKLNSTSLVDIVLAGAEPRTVLPALSRNLSALHGGLSSAQATMEHCEAGAALAMAARLLEGEGEVFVFSDFQRTNWAAVDFARYERLRVYLRPTLRTEETVDNVGITLITKQPREPVQDETIELACTLFNSSASRRLETVHLELESLSRERELQLQPYSSATATFTFMLPQEGTSVGTVRLRGDDLIEDNQRYFAIRVREALRVLLISDTDPDDTTSAAFFLGTALAPSKSAAHGIKVIERRSQGLDRGALESADLFALACPIHLSGEATEVIARRVIEGANLAVFLDGPSATEIVNALAGASQGSISPPFHLLRPVQSVRGESLVNPLTAHGPLKLFNSPTQGDLGDWLVRRRYLNDPFAEQRDEVLVRYPDGSAALSLSPSGRGVSVFVNFPIALDGSNIAGSPLFPAVLYELLRALRRGRGGEEITPGSTWHIDITGERQGSNRIVPYRVIAPNGTDTKVTVVLRGRTVRLALPPPAMPGHYLVKRGDTKVEMAIVNIDANETDLRRLNLADLLRDRPRHTNVAIIDKQGDLFDMGQSRRLWPYLIALAMFALATEMLLLARWRRARRPALRHVATPA